MIRYDAEVVDYATGARGSFCIQQRVKGAPAYMGYWNPTGWAGSGYVFTDLKLALAVCDLINKGQKPAPAGEPQPQAPEGEKCEKCGQWNPVWFVANELWNKAMPNRTGMLCPSCFIKQADKVISNTGWQLVPERPAPAGEPQPQAPEGEK